YSPGKASSRCEKSWRSFEGSTTADFARLSGRRNGCRNWQSRKSPSRNSRRGFANALSITMMFKTQIAAEKLRLMRTSDLADAYELSTAAERNQTLEDWRTLLDISPHGCFGIEIDGALVATTTVVCYEKQLAWIGMVLTQKEYRGRGFARSLLARALEYADSLQIKTVKLDA